MKYTVKQLLNAEQAITDVMVQGWVRTKRDSKEFSFIEVNDGSCLANIQIIVDNTVDTYAQIKHINTGAAMTINGELCESPGKGQRWEIRASRIETLGHASEDFPETQVKSLGFFAFGAKFL